MFDMPVDRLISVRVVGPEPRRQTSGASGYDLTATEDVTLRIGETRIIPTGVRIELPSGVEAQVRGRSGWSRRGLLVHLGTIDSDYRGEVGVIATCLHGGGLDIKAGDRIAQLVFVQVLEASFRPTEELGETERGEAGFGSTGDR